MVVLVSYYMRSNRFRFKSDYKNFNSLIVDLLYLEDSYVISSLGFYLEIVRFISFPKSSYRSVIYFPLFCMI